MVSAEGITYTDGDPEHRRSYVGPTRGIDPPKAHGTNGVMTYTTGFRYEGDFVNGFYEGSGKYSYPDGSSYTGMWVAGARHGVGTLSGGSALTCFDSVRVSPAAMPPALAPHGSVKYSGDFVSDKFHGSGEFSSFLFAIKKGTFHDGKLNGVIVRDLKNARNREVQKRGTYEGGVTKDEMLVLAPKVPTRWVDDSATNSMCMQCGCGIGWGTRHHCRACGSLLCHAHSLKQVPMWNAAAGLEGPVPPQRVCESCLALD